MSGPKTQGFWISFWRVTRVLGGLFGMLIMLDALVPRSAPGGGMAQVAEFVSGLVLLLGVTVVCYIWLRGRRDG